MKRGHPSRILAGVRRRIAVAVMWLVALRYRRSRRAIGTPGYAEFKVLTIRRALRAPALQARISAAASLPVGYGRGIDERVVELPWVAGHLRAEHRLVLDAGSSLNHHWLTDTRLHRDRQLIAYTLAPESAPRLPDMGYVYGDLRALAFGDAVFDAVVCVSTLEHVGMDNTRFYSTDPAHARPDPDGFLQVMTEFARVLRPGGMLLLTVPIGRRESRGWLQQFDVPMLRSLQDAFGGALVDETVYRSTPVGWERSSVAECADLPFLVDVDRGPGRHPMVSAGAVACLALRRA